MVRWLRSRWLLRGYAELAPDAREGARVRVSGIVRAADELVIAPLSGRSCVAFRARVRVIGRQVHRFGPQSSAANAAEETAQVRPFVVERAASAIVVVGEHARFGGRELDGPFDGDRKVSFLARHGNPGAGARYAEIAIAPGTRVTVGGTLVLVPPDAPPPGERGFREPPPLEPRIVGSRAAPLVIVAD